MEGIDARAEELYRQATRLFRGGELQEAWVRCEQSLQCKPQEFLPLHLLGIIALESDKPQQAVDLIARAIAADPFSASARNNQGNALLQLGQCEAAVVSYGAAIALEPELADAHYNLGNAFFDLAQHDAARQSYTRAIELEPNYWRAYNNRGLALWCAGQYAAALADYDRAIAVEPKNPEAYNHRADALRDSGEFPAAISSYDTAIELKPDYAEAFNGRAGVLAALNQYDGALQSYDAAITARPAFAEAYMNRGNVLHELGRSAEALASYDRALALDPQFAEGYYKRGDVERSLNQFEAALADYDLALAIKPNLKFLRGTRLHAKMQLCDWRGVDSDVAALAAAIERGEPVCPPFALLALSESAPLQRRAAEIYVREESPPALKPSFPANYGRHERIRVGYFSSDFRNHPVSYLTAGLIEAHDRSAFDVCAFSTGPDTGDAMRRRLEKAFDRFIDVKGRSDADIVGLARTMELDVAVDLGGFTNGARPFIFARRPAPVQVGYIGYLGTTAAPYMDYLIADEALIPDAGRRHYSEKILYLPSYQSNDPRRRIADKIFTREELGLPPSAFVYCCFNASYKISPAIFAGWMRILDQVPQSVLLLHADVAAIERNLLAEAARAGMDPRRLVFVKSLPQAEYLARYRAADLFLDTLPYNAGTTASDALWAGLPVLTRAGETFAGRMAASLLTAAGVPELIAPTEERYEALAVELARDRGRLNRISRRLADQRATAPLFDIVRFTRHLEAAYCRIHERHRAGLPPVDLDCPAPHAGIGARAS